MDRDTLESMIKKYLTEHESDDVHDISRGLAEKIDKALLSEGMQVKNKIMNDIFGG
jgi:hypothetical protein